MQGTAMSTQGIEKILIENWCESSESGITVTIMAAFWRNRCAQTERFAIPSTVE
jgi:hypothetical protein